VLRETEDEFRSGVKSSCCGNDVSLELSSIDRCHDITFAFELIMLKVGDFILLIANRLERKLIKC